MEQSLQELRTLLKRIGLIIAQHINYVDRLKKSLRDGEAFSHKKCTECAFGKLFLFGDMAQQGPISIGDFRPFGKHRKASLRFSSKGL